MKEKLSLTKLSQKEQKQTRGGLLDNCHCQCVIPPDGSDYANVAFFKIQA